MKKLFCLLISLALICSACVSVFAADEYSYVSEGIYAFYTADNHSDDGKTWFDSTANKIDIDLSSVGGDNHFDDDKGVFFNACTKVYFDNQIVKLINTSKFTVEMVIKDTVPYGTSFATYMNCANDQYSMFIRNGDTKYMEFKCSSGQRPKVAASSYDCFKNSTVTITYDVDGNVCKLYVNGECIDSKDCSAKLSVGDFFFGFDDNSRKHDTEFAAFRFYNRALTADEVAQNYEADLNDGKFVDDTGRVEPEKSNIEKYEGKNIASGKSYVTTGAKLRDSGYNDPNAVLNEDGTITGGICLTNGVKPLGATDGEVAGYNIAAKGSPVEVVLDLGEVKQIEALNAFIFGGSWGISLPTLFSVDFSVSNDNSDFTFVGTVNGSELLPSATSGTWEFYDFLLEKSAEGRYVKYTIIIPESASNFCWLGELEAFGDTEEPAEPSEGPSVEPSEEPSVEPSSEPENPPVKPGDTGLIALAVVSAIALAGVCVIRKH